MKSLIVVYSYHYNNTPKLGQAMAKVLDAQVKVPLETSSDELDVVQHPKLITIQGQDLKIDAAKLHMHKSVKVNDANILKADIETDNGIIHVINKVLLPK